MKVVFITGNSSGIGKQCADYLSKSEEYKVYVTSRHAEAIQREYPVLKMDVSDEDSVKEAVYQVIKKEGRIDVLVNNAGIGFAGAIEDTSIDEAKKQFEINFFGMARVNNTVIPFMRAQREGTIINISSLGGIAGVPFQGFYCASKFAMEGYTESLRLELKPFGIKTVLINPGDFKTNFTQNRQMAAKSLNGSAYKEQLARTLKIIEKEELNGADPFMIARLVKKITTMKNPGVRYYVGKFNQVAPMHLKKFLPSRMFENIVASFYQIRQSA